MNIAIRRLGFRKKKPEEIGIHSELLKKKNNYVLLILFLKTSLYI